MKTITYNGNDIFKDFNAGLYPYDDIDFQESKNSILNAFKSEYQDIITDTLALAGLEYMDLTYFSPSQYNYTTDSIDLTITIKDNVKLLQAIDDKKDIIQSILNDNKSYDGYISLTPDDITGIYKDNDLNIAVIQAILLDIDFQEFDITDHFILDPEQDN
jgi:hypothetical protein